MDTSQIDSICLKDPYLKRFFHGTFPIDLLPKCDIGGYVFNLSDSSSMGTHWVAVYIENKYLDYMDSYGVTAPIQLKTWGKNYEWFENGCQLQSPFTAVCGQYCIYFLMQRARGVAFNDILKKFNHNNDANDKLVYDFVSKRFDLSRTPMINSRSVAMQIAHALLPNA